MNSLNLTKKQIVGLVVLLVLVLVLPLALFLAKERQEIRGRAEEIRKEIVFSLSPQTNSQSSPWPAGNEQTITLKIKNLATTNLFFRVVGVDLSFSSQIFEVPKESLQCASPFILAGEKASKVENNLVSIVCYLPAAGSGPSQPYSLGAGGEINIGSFKVKVKQNPPESATDIIFARTSIPDEENLEDLSKLGAKGTYYIAGAQPTPKLTPIPILTPQPTPTLTPGPTVPPPSCPNGDKGNLNCDNQGLINAGDLSILLSSWSPEGPVPSPRPGQRTADIAPDGAVNAGDLGKLLGNWKVE